MNINHYPAITNRAQTDGQTTLSNSTTIIHSTTVLHTNRRTDSLRLSITTLRVFHSENTPID